MVAERLDKDKLVRDPAPPKPPKVPTAATATLPTEEPAARPLTERRDDVLHAIQEIENTLQYMGKAHPQRASLQLRLDQLRRVLAEMDGEIHRSA